MTPEELSEITNFLAYGATTLNRAIEGARSARLQMAREGLIGLNQVQAEQLEKWEARQIVVRALGKKLFALSQQPN